MSTGTNNNALEAPTILSGSGRKYRIVRVLGQGGFGITYLAVGTVVEGNITGEMQFAIKEHFPSSSCKRVGKNVVPDADKQEVFQSSLTDFIAEAKKLHSLGTENKNIVKVNEVFEENGTAYYVMQYINGESLASYVKPDRKLPYQEAVKLLAPIIDAVGFLHKSRINHLDIKPENIMLHREVEGSVTPILIDFGLSVHFKKNGGKTSPKGVEGVSEGYSPLEQYAGIKEFSPATDIYALAATLLYALTGKTPASAAEIKMADIRASLSNAVPEKSIEAICRAMNKSSDDRTPSVSTFKEDLGLTSGDGGSVTVMIDTDEEKKKKKLWQWVLIGLGAAAVIIAAILLISHSQTPATDPEPVPVDSTQTDSIRTEEPEADAPAEEAAETQTNSDADKSKAEEKVQQESAQTNPAPTPAPKPTPEPTPASKPTVTNGTLNLGYGTWQGRIENGKPDGHGRLTFTSAHRVDSHSSAMANPGDYFIATYEHGRLVSGKLDDSGGNLLQTIIP